MRSLRFGAALVCALPWASACRLTPAWLRGLIELVFLPVCHHWADRVLVVGGEAMCVCSRCAGLYAGLALGFLVGLPRLTARTYGRMLGAAVAVAVVDVVTQDLGLHPPNHAVRLVTGALIGWTAAAWMAASVSAKRHARAEETATARRPRRSLASLRRG